MDLSLAGEMSAPARVQAKRVRAVSPTFEFTVSALHAFTRLKTSWKWAPFPVEEPLTPYPLHYKTAFAFSNLPCPPPQQLPLRVACPDVETSGQRYGFSEFRADDTSHLGSANTPKA